MRLVLIFILVGEHGAIPIINSQSTTTAVRADVVELTPQSVQVDSPVGRLLCHFSFQGSTGVSLVKSVMIPPRTEMLPEGKLAKRAKSHIGMIEPRSSRSNAARQGFSVARVVVKPDNRTVPLRVPNASTTQIELVAGENLADFCPLIESCLSQPHVCGRLGTKQSHKIFQIKSSQ